MNLQKCKEGHFYDGDKNVSCPYCASQSNEIIKTLVDEDHTEILGSDYFEDDKTEIIDDMDEDYEKTELISQQIDQNMKIQFVNIEKKRSPIFTFTPYLYKMSAVIFVELVVILLLIYSINVLI